MSSASLNNPNNPDGALSSMNTDEWNPHGLLAYIGPQGGLILLQFWNANQIGKIQEWAKRSGCKPFSPGDTFGQMVSLIPALSGNDKRNKARRKPAKPSVCPDCGGKHWAWDRKGRGWYCSEQVADGEFCGHQSWKG